MPAPIPSREVDRRRRYSPPWRPLVAVGRGRHDERAEQAVVLATGARGEEEGVRRPVGGAAAAEGDCPEAVDGDRRPVGGVERAAALELALPGELSGVEGVDAAVAVVADEQVAAEETEVGRREGEPPRRGELALGSDAPEQVAGGVRGVHRPLAPAGGIGGLVRGLPRGGPGGSGGGG